MGLFEVTKAADGGRMVVRIAEALLLRPEKDRTVIVWSPEHVNGAIDTVREPAALLMGQAGMAWPLWRDHMGRPTHVNPAPILRVNRSARGDAVLLYRDGQVQLGEPVERVMRALHATPLSAVA